jgi:hypothetical protein
MCFSRRLRIVPHQVDGERHPDHGDRDVDRPFEFRVFLAVVRPSGSVMAAATMIAFQPQKLNQLRRR